MLPAMRVLTIVLALLPASAYAGNDYAALMVGYRGAASTLSTDGSETRSLNHAPRLGFVVYGGDWFLKLRASLYSRPTGDDPAAHFVTEAYGGGEVGVHWPRALGNLAVGLLVDGKTVGVNSAGRDSTWTVGGRGLDGGVSVHFAFPAFGRVRFDPSVAAGASVLMSSDAPTYSGVFALGELEVLVELIDTLSLWVGAGIDVRRYASRASDSDFDGRTFRFDVGIALHDLFGVGHNDF